MNKCYINCTASMRDLAEVTFDAFSEIYNYLTLNLWKEIVFTKSPQHLTKIHITTGAVERTQAII
uniref:Uncharacterized protein n=1 Tax=Laticauda laticaudata TaxID=8630 RepID=A0A8C5S8V4_LATLA